MRIFHLVKKELIELLRQRELLVLIFFMPLVQIIILGYVATTDIKNIPVEIINLSHNRATQPIINRILANPAFRVRTLTLQMDDYMTALKRGQVKAVIVFRDSPDQKHKRLSYPEVQIMMDGVDSNTSLIAAGYINGIIRGYVLTDIAKLGQSMPVANRTSIRFDPELRSINYMGPAIVAMLLTIQVMFMTGVSLVRERENQTMDTLLISRLTPLEIYIGKAIPGAIVGLLEMALGVTVVVLWFDIPMRGSLFSLLVTSLVYLLAILSYGLLIAILSQNLVQVMFFSWISLIIFLLFSGFFTPVSNIPGWLQVVSDINPLRYLMKIIREIFLKGNGIGYFYKDLGILFAIATVIAAISLFNFKRFISK
jgi:ABC-2 type transport system permease protein